MSAPKMQVKCSVENCYYNKNRFCYADALEVNAMGDGIANSSEGTCCTTFIEGIS
ncbi:MAG TPA: DUF1540 domain-containing protein [Syntrophomonadaceae bacterium]|nr:DUF1540 domain-containing protein [Syntrophomonadaceae bacterium]